MPRTSDRGGRLSPRMGIGCSRRPVMVSPCPGSRTGPPGDADP
jgi:hypothetical protein